MNIYAIIVLAAVLIDFILNLTADWLNLKSIRLDPPPALRDIYPPEDYRKSQEYLKVNTRMGLIASSVQIIILLAFWFAGGFNLLDLLVRSWGLGNLVNGLIYIGILMLGSTLISLPFSIYSTFVIEERFGFNKTTPKLFVQDLLKGLLLSLILGIPLLAGVLALFEFTGQYAWIYCWAGVTVFTLAIEFIAPTWIMPLFNKFIPLEQGELKESIMSYARSVDFPLQNILVMDGSRRSSKSNAFFTGFGSNKRIALYDTLIAQHTTGELVAVLAHEIGHFKKKHIQQGIILGILNFGLIFFLLSIFISSTGLYQAFYVEHSSVYMGLILFSLLYSPIELVLSILLNIFSRKNETEADRFAAQTLTKPSDMIDALRKLSTNNLSNLTPSPFYVFLHYSHPPLLQRIETVQNAAGLNTD